MPEIDLNDTGALFQIAEPTALRAAQRHRIDKAQHDGRSRLPPGGLASDRGVTPLFSSSITSLPLS